MQYVCITLRVRHREKTGCVEYNCTKSAVKRGGRIRILSPPAPFVFCFESAAHLMDAAERAIRTLHVMSSTVGRVGDVFFLCVTVCFSERIVARGLFSEYGSYIGAGEYLAAYVTEQADKCIPNAVVRIGEAIKKE